MVVTVSTNVDSASPFKPSTAVFLGATLFAVIFVIWGAMGAGYLDESAAAGLNYVAAAWHVMAFFIIAAVTAPLWAKSAGFAWAAVDSVVDVMNINGADAELAWTIRLGSHIGLALFLVGASLVSTGLHRTIGYLTAVSLAGYSWFAPSLPENFITLPMVGLLAWLVMTGRAMFTTEKSTTGTGTAS